MSWGQHSIGEKIYDLKHLDPFVLTVTPKAEGAPTFRVLVTFGSHTFTRELEACDADEHRFVDGTDTRCFCETRYSCSASLPDIVRRASTGRVFFSEGRNMLCVEWLEGLSGPYAVFFNLSRSPQKGIHAAMFVVSAYEKPALPERLPAMTFVTLVSNVVANKKLVVPNDLRAIKK